MRITAAIALLPSLAFAQGDALVTVRLQPDSIPLGGRALLTFELDAIGANVTWPVIGDTITSHIEVVHDSGADTTTEMRLVRTLSLTSFDTGYWAVPALRFTIGSKEIESEALLLHVRGIALDSNATPKDIKPIHEPPFSLGWWLRQNLQWVAGGTLASLAVIALVLMIRRAHKRKPLVETAPVELSLHERVRQQLVALDKERVWQQGDHKGYQSRLTDLLRGYIEERFQVPALERTTDELLHELRVSPLNTDQQNLLGNMLRLADMVKFAKALPTPQENEQMMANAMRFVQETALQPTIHAPRS